MKYTVAFSCKAVKGGIGVMLLDFVMAFSIFFFGSLLISAIWVMYRVLRTQKEAFAEIFLWLLFFGIGIGAYRHDLRWGLYYFIAYCQVASVLLMARPQKSKESPVNTTKGWRNRMLRSASTARPALLQALLVVADFVLLTVLAAQEGTPSGWLILWFLSTLLLLLGHLVFILKTVLDLPFNLLLRALAVAVASIGTLFAVSFFIALFNASWLPSVSGDAPSKGWLLDQFTKAIRFGLGYVLGTGKDARVPDYVSLPEYAIGLVYQAFVLGFAVNYFTSRTEKTSVRKVSGGPPALRTDFWTWLDRTSCQVAHNDTEPPHAAP